jgi:hypothetical protein
LFRISRPTARAWRDRLLHAGLVAEVDGWLQLVPDRFAAWKAEQARALAASGRSWRCGRLPAALLAVGRGHDIAGLTPRQLLAAATLIAEADRERDGIAADAELAARAGCSRNTLRAARAALILAGLLLATKVRRGRSAMTRAQVTKQAWRTALAGLARMAQLADRHRRGARRRRGKPLNTPPCPYGDFQKAEQKQILGRRGASSAQEPTRNRHVAIETLMAGLGRHMRHHAASTPPPSRSRYLEQLLTPAALARLARMNPATACEQVLMGAGAMSRSPQRRSAAAAMVARALGRAGKPAAVALVAVLADVLLDRPRDVGAVLSWRCGALARGGLPVNRTTTPWSQLIADARQVVSA